MKKRNKMILLVASIFIGAFAGFSYVDFQKESSYFSLTSRVSNIFFSRNDTIVANIYEMPIGKVMFDSFNLRSADVDFKSRDGFQKSSGGFKVVKLIKESEDTFYLYRYEDDYLQYINPRFAFEKNIFSDSLYSYSPPIENYRPTPEIGYMRAMKLLSKGGYLESYYDSISNFFLFIKELKVQDYYKFKLISNGKTMGNPYYHDNDFVLWYKEIFEEYGLVFQKDFYYKQLLIFVPIFILAFIFIYFIVINYMSFAQKTAMFLLAITLLLCLLHHQYDFYLKVRYINTIGFIYIATLEEKHFKKAIYLVFAFLFQPFFEISFDRQVWNIIDIIIALWLLVNIFNNSKKIII